MIIIPAIDLMGGKVVRLEKGIKKNYKVYSNDPVETAEKFYSLGAERIHIVDLDAAFDPKHSNFEIIRKIIDAVPAKVEVGGGIRDIEDVEKYLSAGAYRIIIGTMAVKEPEKFGNIIDRFGDKIIAGVDILNGFVHIAGWVEDTKIEYLNFLGKMKDMGIREVIITDIKRDGMLSGVDVDFYRDVVYRTDLKVIVSGGIRDKSDIEKLQKMECCGVYGVIIGKAIYEKRIDLKNVLEAQ